MTLLHIASTLDELRLRSDLPNWLETINAKQLIFDPNTDPQTRQQLLYLACYHDFEFFVQVFFPAHIQYGFSDMHRAFFQAERNPARRGRREAIAAPRGHAKTTMKALFKVIHSIVYGYEQFIVILGHSKNEAKSKVKDILEELENNLTLQEIYGPLAPIRGQLGWSTKDFITQNNIRVMAASRCGQVRGLKHGNYRPTLIILDDVEALDKVFSEEQRYKTKQWLEKDILKLGSVDGSANIIFIGTCLHPESLLSDVLVTPGWQSVRYQAVLSFPIQEALWKQWEAIYTDLANPNHEQDAQTFYEAHQQALLEGVEVLWPEGEPYLQLRKMMVIEGMASFQSEKQNDPYDPTRQIFDMQKAKRFRVEYHDDGDISGLRWLDGSNRFVHVHQLGRMVAYHDPAMADTKESDYAAIVVCVIDENRFVYCLDAYIEKVPPSRQIEQAYAMHEKWGFYKLILETNNFQGVLKERYRDMQDQAPQKMRVTGITVHHNKIHRISSLEPLITNGQLLFNENITPRLISQMTQFPTSHDDGPDALHGAVSQLRKR